MWPDCMNDQIGHPGEGEGRDPSPVDTGLSRYDKKGGPSRPRHKFRRACFASLAMTAFCWSLRGAERRSNLDEKWLPDRDDEGGGAGADLVGPAGRAARGRDEPLGARRLGTRLGRRAVPDAKPAPDRGSLLR